jgi:hypothetical protein
MAKLKALTVVEFVKLVMSGVKHPLGGLIGCTVPTLTVKDRNDHARTWAVAFPTIDKANVRKIVHAAIFVGPDYAKMVENELMKENKDPDAWKRGNSWHEAVPGTRALRQHKSTGELYFWCAYVQKRQLPDGSWVHLKPKVKYVDISTGVVIDRKKLNGFTEVEKLPTNQKVNAGREVIVRCYKLESVKTLVVDGVCYTIVGKTL